MYANEIEHINNIIAKPYENDFYDDNKQKKLS